MCNMCDRQLVSLVGIFFFFFFGHLRHHTSSILRIYPWDHGKFTFLLLAGVQKKLRFCLLPFTVRAHKVGSSSTRRNEAPDLAA